MIKPFADESAAASIGDLSVENGTAKVLISGSVEITRDQSGLKHAQALKRLADDLVAALEGGNVPQHAKPAQAATVDKVDNPFA